MSISELSADVLYNQVLTEWGKTKGEYVAIDYSTYKKFFNFLEVESTLTGPSGPITVVVNREEAIRKTTLRRSFRVVKHQSATVRGDSR